MEDDDDTESEIDRLLAELGLELPDVGDDEEPADRFIGGWDDPDEMGNWNE